MKPPLIESIPAEVRAQLGSLKAVEVGFGAGPGCAAVNIKKQDPPITFESALAWLEGYRGTFRKGHVKLEDGTHLFFDPTTFLRVRAPGEA